jgi:hypothetical protein
MYDHVPVLDRRTSAGDTQSEMLTWRSTPVAHEDERCPIKWCSQGLSLA